MGEDVLEQMLRTTYVGVLDTLTRQHLTHYQGIGTEPEALKREVLRLVNNAVAENTPMQIGSVEEESNRGGAHGAADSGEPEEWDEWDRSEDINAIKGS